MNGCCTCCGGLHAPTQRDIVNLPGQSRLARRVGTYGDFLGAMQAQLSGANHPALAALRTRAPSDATMALIDAWAVASDVLTFYQERLCAEGYLRSALERRSVFELARLVDYRPRPGVAASVLLAYSLDDKSAPVTLPVGSKAQDVPAPGAAMQTFETSEPLLARVEWNRLTPRLGQAPVIDFLGALLRERINFVGSALDLRPGDRLVFAFSSAARRGEQVLRRVLAAQPDFSAGVTRVWLQAHGQLSVADARNLAKIHDELARLAVRDAGDPPPRSTVDALILLGRISDFAMGAELDVLKTGEHDEVNDPDAKALAQRLNELVAGLRRQGRTEPPSFAQKDPLSLLARLDRAPPRIPANAALLTRSLASVVSAHADAPVQLLTHLRPRAGEAYYRAWANLPARTPIRRRAAARDFGRYSDLSLDGVHVLRTTAALYGHNAPHAAGDAAAASLDGPSVISLEGVDDAVAPGSVVVVERQPARGGRRLFAARAASTADLARTDYGLRAKSTRIELVDLVTGEPLAWKAKEENLLVLATTLAHVRGGQLTLADDPLEEDVEGASIELAILVDGLQTGRRIIVTGERTDVRAADGSIVPGLEGREAAMITAVTQDAPRVGDRPHTILGLSTALAYSYRRDSVSIYANVARATHGETRNEPLGGGDGTQALQTFTLKQQPLTFVPARTPSGVQSTLEVRVNDVRWRETDSLAEEPPAARVFVAEVAEDAQVKITFGTGQQGARLPTGMANVRAVYRNGIGRVGNVKADSISLLTSRPLGVRDVINPLRATGGADAETRDQARRNAPLAVAALDRLVSLRDYADFARTFAGIGHAAAARISDGVREIVQVTVAGLDDAPLDADSELLADLASALRLYGDPTVPLRVAPRELVALLLSARVTMHPDYLWQDVAARLRAALLAAFAFEKRPLSRSAYLSECVAAMQPVAGVVSVDVDVFQGLAESELADPAALTARAERLVPDAALAAVPALPARAEVDGDGRLQIRPAQLAFFVPEVAETLVLNRR